MQMRGAPATASVVTDRRGCRRADQFIERYQTAWHCCHPRKRHSGV